MPVINIGINSTGATAGASRVNNALGSISRKAKSVAGGAFTPLNTAIAAIGSGATVVGLAHVADEYTVMAAQLEYVTGTAQDAAFVQEDLHDISRKTGTSMKDNADTYVKLSQAQKLTGLTSEENIKIIGALNGLMIKTGTSGVQTSAAMLQLSQALTSGKLAGDEYRSMAENAPGVLNELAKAIGVPREELKKWSTEGKLTSELIGKGLLKIAEDGSVAFDELPQTVSKGWNSVVLEFQKAWDELNDETGIMGWLYGSLEKLADWIVNNKQSFSSWITDMADVVRKEWPGIKQAFGELILAFVNLVGKGGETNVTMENIGNTISAMAAKIEPTIRVLATLVEWLDKYIQLMKEYSPLAAAARVVGGIVGGIESGQGVGGIITDIPGNALGNSNGTDNKASSAVRPTVNNYYQRPVTPREAEKITDNQTRQAAQI